MEATKEDKYGTFPIKNQRYQVGEEGRFGMMSLRSISREWVFKGMKGRTTEINGVTCIAKVESLHWIEPENFDPRKAKKKSYVRKKRFMENPRKFCFDQDHKAGSISDAFHELARLQDIQLDACLKGMDRSESDDEIEGISDEESQ